MGSALTMEPGTLLQQQQQLPLHNDYSLSSNADALDQFPGHAHHSSYTTNGAVEPLRRDISLVQQSTGAFAYATSGNTAGPRYVPSRNVAPDGRSYPATQNLTDSGSGSISTSPSSAASSLAYNNYQQANHYTGSVVPSYPGTVPLAQPFVPQSYTGARAPSILDGSTQSVLSPSTRSPLSGATNATDRDVYTNASPYLARNALSPSVQSSYPHYADPSRSILTAAAAGLSLTGVPSSGSTHMATPGAHAYGGMQNESLNFPWPNLEVLLELHCGDMPVTPEVHAKVEKGFFLSTVDDKWTCYRRNYFSVNCHFELHPNVSNGRLTIKRNNHTEQVMAMGMRLSAAVDGSQGKSIELVQHTPKRDAGPKNKIDVTKVSPTPTGRLDSTISPHGVYQIPMHTFHATGHHPGPILPFQSKPDDTSLQQSDSTPTMSQFNMNSSGSAHIPLPGSSTTHTFERIQFKQATANNGKRRASQQYFHLVVELFVDIRKGENDVPSWVKIAQRVSEKIVVRGRSPSHYQNEGQNGTTGRGGSTGSNGGYSTGGASFGAMNAGGFRGAGSHYSGGNGGVNGYRANHYGLGIPLGDPGSHSGSSSSSIDGGPVDGYPVDTVMSDADRIALHEHSGYQYYPSTIYEGMPTQLPPLGKIESNARFSTEPRQYAVKTEYSDAIPGAQYSASGIGRFQGVDSSRGYYPDLQTGCH